jgi:signal transduction histidine kinase/DNA-binding response OmpR family regulator
MIMSMKAANERILVVEYDPEISDLISRQTLTPLGYRVEVVGAAGAAIKEAVRFAPDLIIANLNLPGLSGKDMMVALTAQGLEVPIIVLAEKGMEADVIQAFRLGATDFLYWPVREAEVVTCVERALRQVRSRREREVLSRQLNQTNQELQHRVRELTTIFAIGKAVTSITDQNQLLDRIVDGAVQITEADSGWLLLREDRSKNFTLSAFRNVPKSIATRQNQPWDDGLSSLVALSGETLTIHGDPLKRFKIAQLGQSALVVPVKVKKDVVGLLVVLRKIPQPFNTSNQALLEAVADYAAIALVNIRLFKAQEERARFHQKSAEIAALGEQVLDDLLNEANSEIQKPLNNVLRSLESLMTVEMRVPGQTTTLLNIKEQLGLIKEISDALSDLQLPSTPKQSGKADLAELARQALARFQPIARQADVALFAEVPSASLFVPANLEHLSKVLDGLLSNAIRFSAPGSPVRLRLEIAVDGQAHLSIIDQGIGIAQHDLTKLFDKGYKIDTGTARRFGGLGIRLHLIREIINLYGGKIWVDSKIHQGSIFHVVLPVI